MERQDVELKPVPKQMRAPKPGEPITEIDNPIDAARAHVNMAETSLQASDWDGAKAHLRQAGEAIDQIEPGNNRNVTRYLTNLRDDMRRAEKAIDNRDRDVESRLELLDTHLRNMKPDTPNR